MIDAFSYKHYLECRNKAIFAMLADCGLRSMEIRGQNREMLKKLLILLTEKEAGNRAEINDNRVHTHSFHFYSVQSLSTDRGMDVYSLSRLLGILTYLLHRGIYNLCVMLMLNC